MTVELYDALIEAGASKEKAVSAAKIVSATDSKLNKIELMIIGLYISLGGIGIMLGYMFGLLNTIVGKLS